MSMDLRGLFFETPTCAVSAVWSRYWSRKPRCAAFSADNN